MGQDRHGGRGMKTLLLRVRGRVQGVWYRGWAVREANKRGLNGWVRNRADGTVEVMISGADASVDDMARACQSGPPAAQVDRISASVAPAPEEAGFQQLPSR